MDPAKAELLGFLAAEGNEYHYSKTCWRFFRNEGPTGRWYLIHYKQNAIEFTNLEPNVQKRFLELLESVYGSQKIRFGSRWRIRIRQKHVVSDLLSYSRLGSLEWRVPVAVTNGGDRVKAAWCRGFADGDGTVARTQIRLDSINSVGLKDVQDILQSLGINSILRGPYSQKPYQDRFCLAIYRQSVPQYANLIGFIHQRKNTLLRQLLKSSLKRGIEDEAEASERPQPLQKSPARSSEENPAGPNALCR